MSDYGDDYSDYGGDEWLWIEDEYMAADDLAEHAVQSPPPTLCDEDLLPDFDRFDYFNDLEYASDGYDDATFLPQNSKNASQIGQKRKRGVTQARSRKRQVVGKGQAAPRIDTSGLVCAPIVWRSQQDRDPKPRLVEENVPSYALLKDWREKLADTPRWACGSPHPKAPRKPNTSGNGKAAITDLAPGIEDEAEGEDEEDDGGEEMDVDPSALMAVLQDRLASAGGPLSGMDPEQLMQFAMRMMNNKEAGDDVAGEMADEMLNQGEDDEQGEESEANLLSWLNQQRNAGQAHPTDADNPNPTAATTSKKPAPAQPPTPPSSEATRSVRAADETLDVTSPKTKNAASHKQNNEALDTGGPACSTRKRKAENSADEGSSGSVPKKRATRSYDAPTAASEAKAAPSKATRSGRVRR